jgi:hypothetical protein
MAVITTTPHHNEPTLAAEQPASERPRTARLGLGDYLRGISFRLLQPLAPKPPDYEELRKLFALRFDVPFDTLNTRLPEDEEAMVARLAPLRKMPKMSTFAIGAIINRIVSEMPDDTVFVNVGVWMGYTFLAGLIGNPTKTCIGVDNLSVGIEGGDVRASFLQRFAEHKSDRHVFYEMDYRDYFARVHRELIGFYLYDADHSYEHQLNGLRVAEPFFAEGCVVMVDDTNWDAVWRATMDFIAQSPNRYRILLDRMTAGNDHPTFWNGLLVFQRVD